MIYVVLYITLYVIYVNERFITPTIQSNIRLVDFNGRFYDIHRWVNNIYHE